MAEEKTMSAAMLKWFRDRCSLLKAPISLMSACAAIFGYTAQGQELSVSALMTGVSVFCISGGAAALNNVQDRRIDGFMERTRTRPIPGRRIRPGEALLISALLIVAGGAGLYISSSTIAAPLAGLSAVILYNAIYTPLKLKTQYALIPGVICGMLPPLMGWLSAGGDPSSQRIWYIMILFGTWQVPHFWLLLLSRREDYQRSRIPTILDKLTVMQLKRLVCLWVGAFALLASFMRLFLIMKSTGPVLLVLGNAVIMPAIFTYAMRGPRGLRNFRHLFHYLNTTTLGIMGLGIIDSALLSSFIVR
jgi:protoheme IX farnesyltransferase